MKLRANEVSVREIDGEMVLLDLRTSKYLTANGVRRAARHRGGRCPGVRGRAGHPRPARAERLRPEHQEDH